MRKRPLIVMRERLKDKDDEIALLKAQLSVANKALAAAERNHCEWHCQTRKDMYNKIKELRSLIPNVKEQAE